DDRALGGKVRLAVAAAAGGGAAQREERAVGGAAERDQFVRVGVIGLNVYSWGVQWLLLSGGNGRTNPTGGRAAWALAVAGAVRFRMPDEGTTAWDDVVRGHVEFPNEKLEDLVLTRSDGRPTYNFASPMEDVWDGITHVIRGEDHISNTPKQINIIGAVGSEPPVYAHVSHVLGADGKSLSKRHGSVTVDEFRHAGYYAPALLNFLALLGWSYDDKTTIMSRDELIERFGLERVVPSPATFDYQKLDWMNGVYLRALPPDEYADELARYLREQGYDWDEELVRRAAPLVQEKIERFGQFPEFAGFLFRQIEPDPALLDGDPP